MVGLFLFRGGEIRNLGVRGSLKFQFFIYTYWADCLLLRYCILWYDGYFLGAGTGIKGGEEKKRKKKATIDTTNGYFRRFLAPSSFRFVPWLLRTKEGG